MTVGFIGLGALFGVVSAVFSLLSGHTILFALGVYALSGFATVIIGCAGYFLASSCAAPLSAVGSTIFARNNK